MKTVFGGSGNVSLNVNCTGLDDERQLLYAAAGYSNNGSSGSGLTPWQRCIYYVTAPPISPSIDTYVATSSYITVRWETANCNDPKAPKKASRTSKFVLNITEASTGNSATNYSYSISRCFYVY